MKVEVFVSNLSVWKFLIATVLILLLVNNCSFFLGRRYSKKEKLPASDIISNNILGLLALILGFSFAMAVDRYERRRLLAVDAANSIKTAYLRSGLINFDRPDYVKDLFKKYVDLRINAYHDPHPEKLIEEIQEVQEKLWKELQAVVVKSRGEIENAYLQSLNEMFENANARYFALLTMVPASFYIIILIMAAAAVGLMGFDRGQNQGTDHWRSLLFIILFGVVSSFVFDMDHFRKGIIRIGIDPILDLRKTM